MNPAKPSAIETEEYFFGRFERGDPNSPSGQTVPGDGLSNVAPHSAPVRRYTPEEQRLGIFSAALGLQDSVFGYFEAVASGFFLLGGIWMAILLCYCSKSRTPSPEPTTSGFRAVRGNWPPLTLLSLAIAFSSTSATVAWQAAAGLQSVVKGFGSDIAIRPGETVKAVEISTSVFILVFGMVSVLWNHWGRGGKLKTRVQAPEKAGLPLHHAPAQYYSTQKAPQPSFKLPRKAPYSQPGVPRGRPRAVSPLGLLDRSNTRARTVSPMSRAASRRTAAGAPYP